MVQQPLNPAVLEAARQLLDRTTCVGQMPCNWARRWRRATCFKARRSCLCLLRRSLLEAAAGEGFKVLDPAKETGTPAKEAE